jgi:hypothetical protein
MASDNIFQQYLRPVKSVAEYGAEYDDADNRSQVRERNALELAAGQQKFGESQQATQRAAQLRGALMGLPQSATDDDRIKAMRGTGSPEGFSAADALDKSLVDRKKGMAAAGKDEADAAKTNLTRDVALHDFHAQKLATVQTLDDALAWAQEGSALGLFKQPGQYERGVQLIQQAAQSPQSFAQWKTQAMQGGQSVTEQLKQQLETAKQADQVRNNQAQIETQRRGQDITARTANSRLAFDKEQATAESAPDTTTQREKELWLHTYTANNGQMPRSAPPAVRKYIGTWAAEMGITPNDLSSGAAKSKFDQAMAVTAGHRGGAMASVEATMPALVENAQDLSHKLGQGKFVPLNKLAQMSNENISDPTLAAFKVAHMAVVSEYQQVISRGGTNVTALNEAMHVLNGARSVEAYDSAMNMVKKEVAINVAGAKAVRAGIGSDNHGAVPAAAPATAPTGFDPGAIAAELKKRGH